MKRRHLLQAAIGGGVALTVGAVGAVVIGEAEVAAAVRRHLSMLRLDPDAPRAFAKAQAAELLAKRPTWFRIKFHIRQLFTKEGKSFTGNVDFGQFFSDRRSHREKLEQNLAMIFLLSSDFFWNGADETKVVHYVALYDPMRACGNPFARSSLPAAAGTAIPRTRTDPDRIEVI